MLKKSIYAQVPIVLGLKNLPDAVALPSYLELVTDRSRYSLPLGTRIIDQFNAIGKGSRTMLILGQPGSGKTIALLQLAQELLDRADKDESQRLPVVINLSSWAQDKKPLADWLVQELHNFYGVNRKIGKVWIEQQDLLLLLDGLDEIRSESDRSACIRAINTFQQQHPTELVVCCRIRDYKMLKTRFCLNRAIYLKHLTRLQIEAYLAQFEAKTAALKTLLVQDQELQKLARSPLMLNIMVLVYEGMIVDDIPEISPDLPRTQQLFDAYIDRMFRGLRRLAHQIPLIEYQTQVEELYSRHQARYWLIWLAKQMEDQSQTVLLIERLQPALLKEKERAKYQIIWLNLGIMSGLTLCLLGGVVDKLILGLILGLFSGLLVYSKSELKQFELVEALDWRFEGNELKRKVLRILLATMLIMGAMIVSLGVQSDSELISELTRASIGSLGGTFMVFLLLNLRIVKVSTRTKPNQGTWRSARNCLSVSLIFGVLSGLCYGLVFDLFSGLLLGLFSGLLFALLYGGSACVQHLVLRCLLYHRGVMPWNYARFLNWSSDKLFLQRVGGGYIFVHRLLMEHFAQMDLDERQS